MSHPQRPSLFRRVINALPSRRRYRHKRLERRQLVAAELLESRALLANIQWGNASGGNWNVASNWVGGAVPGANDDVIIPDFAGSPTITFNTGTVSVKSLTTSEIFVISGGTFTATSIQQSAGAVRLAGGTLQNTSLASGVINVTGASTLSTVTIESAASLVVAPGVAVSIPYEKTVTVNGTFQLQTGSTLNLGGAWDSNFVHLLVIGTLRTENSTINGSRFIHLTNAATVDVAGADFNTPILTHARHIDAFSQAGGGKDNKRFLDIYISNNSLSTGTLNLRQIGTQTTQNLRYIFKTNFAVAAGTTVNVMPNVRAEIPYEVSVTVDGAFNLQSGSTLNLGGAWDTNFVHLLVNGTLFTENAFINGSRFIQLTNSAVVNVSNTDFNTPILTNSKHIDAFSQAGGGKDNKRFSDIYIANSSLSTGTLNLRQIGTQTTQNLRYYFKSSFAVALGTTVNVMSNVRVEIPYEINVTVDGTFNMQSGSTLNLGGAWDTNFVHLLINGTLFTENAFINGSRFIQLTNSAVVNVSGTDFNVPILTNSKHIDAFSLAGGGKDNKRFLDIYIANNTLSTTTLNLRQIGTQSTQNLRYYFKTNFSVPTSTTVNVMPNVRVEIPYEIRVTVDGTFSMQSGSTLNLGGAWDSNFVHLLVNGTLFTDNASINGGRYIQLTNSAVVDVSGTDFNVPIFTNSRHVDAFSQAGGGKDNKRFSDIYFTNATLSTGTLNLRPIGTQSTQNLYYHFGANYLVASGATVNVMPNVRAEIAYERTVTIDGVLNLQSGSVLNFGGAFDSNFVQLIINGGLDANNSSVVGVNRFLQINSSANVTFLNTAVSNTLLNVASAANVSVGVDAGVSRVFGAGGLSRVQAGLDSVNINYGSTLAIPQSLEVGASATATPNFSVSYASTLSLTGSLSGKTQAANNFQGNGRILFNGSGTTAAPQKLEVMSADLGATSTGFATGNFALGKLELANSTVVQLTNASINRPGAASEAVYANTLIVGSGSKLDLNGMKLYVRAFQNLGSIVNGTVNALPTIVADGGPLAFSTPTPGTIDSGATDTWTFSANQNGQVMVQVNPGTSGVTAAVPTVLKRVRIQLLSSSDSVLKTVENDADGNLVTLTSDPLTSGQNYKIRVQAHSGFPTLAGNYVITLVNTNSAETAIAITPDATSASKLEGNSGTTDFKYNVTRFGDLSGATSINWVVTGTAANPSNANDFAGSVLPSGVITFANTSEVTKTITISVNGDTIFENDESFKVTLSNPTTPMSITQGSVTSVVLNDDQPLNSDLIVSAIAPPTAALSGQRVTLAWTEKNIGAATALGTWSTQVTVINRTTGQTVYSLASVFPANSIAPQATADRSVQFDLPNGIAGEGTYEVSIFVDSGRNITEANVSDTGESNNTSTSSFTAGPGLYPDLTVAEIVAPTSVQLNVPFDISWRVNNVGTAPLGKAIRDRIYLSTDAIVDNSDRILGTLDNAAALPLAAGGSYTQPLSVTLQLDASLTAGTYNILVVSDFANEQFETVETNNTLSRSITISLPPLPDLVVTSIETRGLVVAGQTVPVTWVVKNQGTLAATGPWTDRVLLSDNPSIGDDSALGDYPVTTTILPDGSIQRTQEVAIPAGLSGVYYFVIATDAINQVEEFNRENNNVTIDDVPITIDSRPSPNLVVESVSALTSSLFSGQPATVAWVVRNIGNASTNSSAWEDRVYLSNDDVLSNDDALLGRVPNTSYLNSGEVYSSSLTANLPEDAVGERYFIVVTDATNAVAETAGENDNSRASIVTQIALTDFADLFITSVAAPRNAFEGESIRISWFVKNQGKGPTRVNQWVDQIYVSYNGNDIDASDILLDTVTRNGGLAVGEEYSFVSYSVLLPEDRVADEAYIIVRTDATRKVYEHSFEGNNDRAAEFATPIQLRSQPDLRVEAVTAPESAIAGQPLVVSFIVTNPTGTPTRQSVWQDSVYLSTDDRLDPQTDLLLGSRSRTGVLSGGQAETRDLTFTLSNTLEGTYFVFVLTDSQRQVKESDDENNVGRAEGSLSIVINPPDLAVTALTTAGTPLAGRELTVNYSVTNQGGSPTPLTSWTDAIFLSRDNRLDNDDRLVSERLRTGVLTAGSTESRSVNVRLPVDWIGGGYLIVRSDNRNEVYELNNENNVVASPITVGDDRPDLTITSFEPRLGARQIRPGSTLSFDYTVTNRGLGTTYGQSWTDRLVLSSDLILGNSDDILLKSISSPRDLPAGQSYSRVSDNVQIPANTPEGMVRLFMVADAIGIVGETNESNNTQTSSEFTISNSSGGDTQLSDLTIATLTAPATIESGNDMPISWTVRNANFAPTNTSIWYDDVWLSKDSTIDSSDILVGRYLHNTALASNEQYTRTINYPLGADMEGTYYVIVSTDATNRVTEGFGEANNQRFSAPPTTITLGPVADLRVSSIAPPATAFSGRATPLTWTVENVGGRTATAPWLDRAYLSLDQIFDPATDLPLGFAERSGSLPSGSNYTATKNVDIPIGIGGNYYVIVATDSSDGVYERALENNNVTVSTQPINITHLPPADLVVGDITIPVNGQLNQNATINFTVSNTGSFTARGGWYDAIYFSSDDNWDINDGYFGRVLQTSDVAAGASYNATLTAPLPGVLPGDYKVIIRSDIRNNVLEANEANNLKGTLNSVALDAPALTLGVASAGNINKGGAVYYKVTVPAGETVAIEFDGLVVAGATELYSSFGSMPRRSGADHVAALPYQADQRIVISSTLGGTYYILAVAQDMESSSSNYSILARIVPFSVFDTSYGQGGTAGFRTIAINGAKFDRSVTAELVDASGQASPAVRYYRTSDTQVYATFDLRALSRGNYTVRLNKASTSESVVVNNGLQVVFATASQEPLSLTRPDSFNRRRDDRAPAIIPVSLGWRNTSLNDIAVPLIHFSATDPFAFTLADAKDGRTIETTEFLGLSTADGPRDILMPGEFVSRDFFIAPRAVPANSPAVDIHYVAEYFYNVDDANYPWDFDLSQLDMSYLNDDEAIAHIDAFRQAFDSSVGSYRLALTAALQRAGEELPQELSAANRYLLQDIFDRFVASRETSLVGQLTLLNTKVDFEGLVVTLSAVGGTELYSTNAWQDGSFVFPKLPVGEYLVRVSGGAAKAAEGLKVTLASGEHASVTIQLTSAATTTADATNERTPVGVSPISAPQITRFGTINTVLSGNVLASIMAQLAGIPYRIEQVGDAPVGFNIQADGTYTYLSSQNDAFVVHYDLVLPDTQTRVGRLFESEIRSRGVLAITLKNNFTRDVRAVDPNDIIGPEGYGPQKWVSANERLGYKIRFENNPEANSPAGMVTIEQTLDSDLDASTVEFGTFAFGGREFNVRAKSQTLNDELDLTQELGIFVRVFAFVDVASRKVSWTFSSISPKTGTDITDPSQGFLPPNKVAPQGDGSVSYSVKAKRSAVTGAIIDAQARIIFDGNAAIDTPAIFNTLDATRPISKVVAAEFNATDSRVYVVWDGEDGEGAGLASFDVYVSTNGGKYERLAENRKELEWFFTAAAGSSYSIITIARDNVGNAESDSKLPDAARPVAEIVGSYQLREGVATQLNGRAQDPDGLLTAFIYEWDFDYHGDSFQVDATTSTPNLLIADGPATRTVALRVKGTAADAPYSLISTTSVSVENVAPTLTRQSTAVSAFVNTEMRNSGTWQDALGDIVTLTASLGSVVLNADGTWNWSFLSSTVRNNETVTITATDEDNAASSITFSMAADFNPATFLPQLRSPISGLTNTRVVTVQLDFGSPVINFTDDDLQLAGATMTALTDLGGGKFNIDLQASATGTVSIVLLAGRVLDGQGRSNQATGPVTWQFFDTSATDFGDAPDSSSTGFPQSYPTLLADDGARHLHSSLRLGAHVDVEADGQPAALAQGDDSQGNPDDEDGIQFAQPILSSSFATTMSSFVATASADGKLDAWIDFNRDGDWSDAGERISVAVNVTAGVNVIPFVVPQGAFVGDTYARFRISSQGNLLPTGSADDGEVEDHAVSIDTVESPRDLVIDSQLIGAHRLEVINNQLTLTADSRVFFQAIVSSIRRVSYVAADGTTEIYAVAAPESNLLGVLTFVSADQSVTIQTTRTSLDLSTVVDQVHGVNRIELVSAASQELRFDSAAITRLNAAGRLQIVTGDKDTVPVGKDWKYTQTRSEASLLFHTFATTDGATIELLQARQWQNAIVTNDVTGNGTVEPRDALLVINQINLGSRLPQFNANAPSDFFFADTNGDGQLSPIDALLIINQINSSVASGEGEQLGSPSAAAVSVARPVAEETIDTIMGQVDDWSTDWNQKRRKR